ncbi:MAG: alpha/beta hydrolase [Prevotella sp.]|nr:alpha/beta hydrolase [Prevotella sp.]MCM1075611.1 alpha/beta hydrolase [Ruminococcus sp.]
MEKDIEVDNLNLHYDESGPESGSVIVLLHGWGCNLTTVASIRKMLEHKMHVFSFDLPGFGKSSEPPTVWGIEDYTRFVEKAFNKLGISNPILLGHSFGGRISILYSSRNMTDKIILTDAAGVKPHHSLKWYLKVYSFKAAKRLYPLILGKEKAQKRIEKSRAKRGSSDYNNATPMMRAILSKCVNEDLCNVMPRIKASTLLIWGENDTATPLADAKKMEKLIPDAGLVAFPGCGHYSFLDNPGGFKAVINSFLSKELA